MATLFDDASLVMIPSGYKDDKLYSIKPTSGDGDFTFSRDGSGASPATRVNSAGLIEKGRENYNLYSNTFTNAYYAKGNVSITPNTAANPIDGVVNASTITASGIGTESRLRVSNAIAANQVQVISIYAKYTNHQYIYIRQIATNKHATFDIQNGSVSYAPNDATQVEVRIDSVGSGWYRLVYAFNASSMTNNLIDVGLSASSTIFSGSVAAGANAYIFAMQLEAGLVATSYIETTTAAASAGILGDMPRLDYSGGATCPSLLLEPARTNLAVHSEYLGASDWTKTRCTIEDNSATSPEGVENASKMTSNDASESYIQDNFSFTGSTIVWSFFAKKGDLDYCHGLVWDLSANGCRQWFNLNDGTVGGATTFGSGYSVSSATIEDYGSGWYRCVMIVSGSSGSNGCRVSLSSANTTITSAVNSYGYFYGLQAEDSSYPTSYVPTYGSATARAADSCSKTGISSLIGQTEGTLFIDFIRPANALIANQVIYGITDTGSQNRLRILTTGSDAVRVLFQTNGNQIEYDVNLSFTLTPDNTPIKLAVGYKSGDIACYVNGNQADTSSNSITITTSIENIEINSTPNSNIVSQALLFDTRLTNAELAALTTI